jgi:selenocysteine lyase/cysteine desulfurase
MPTPSLEAKSTRTSRSGREGPLTGSEAVLIEREKTAAVPEPIAAHTRAFAELERAVYAALETYSNVHRGAGHHSMVSTALYERAKEIVLEHLGLDAARYVVVFCSGWRAAELEVQLEPGSYQALSSRDIGLPLGLTALAVSRSALPKGTPIQTGGDAVDLVARGYVVWADAPRRFEAGTPSIVKDLQAIGRVVHRYGARFLVDGAQLVAHRSVDMMEAGIDYLAFSGHKLYAPFGSGALVIRRGLLNCQPAELARIRASGEENSVGIAALGKAMTILQRVGMDVLEEAERSLTRRTLYRQSIAPNTPGQDVHRRAGPQALPGVRSVDSPGCREGEPGPGEWREGRGRPDPDAGRDRQCPQNARRMDVVTTN